MLAVGADGLGARQPPQEQIQGLGEAGLVAGQPGPEDLQVHPRAATGDTQVEPAAGDLVEQDGLLGQRDRVAVGHDRGGGRVDVGAAHDHVLRHGRARPEPTDLPDRQHDHRGRAHPVGQEVVFGDPRAVEPGRLSRDGVVDRVAQGLGGGGAGELPSEQEHVDREGRAGPARTIDWVSSHAVRVTG